MDTGHWEHPLDFDINDWVGFCYRIINLKTGQEYIGKKQFFSITRRKVKNRKNRKVIKKESNWKSYTSSSEYVNAEIEEKGKDNFRFIIESLHKSKASLFYREIEMQIFENVLRETMDNGEKKYYNRMIGNVKFIPPNDDEDETRHRQWLLE